MNVENLKLFLEREWDRMYSATTLNGNEAEQSFIRLVENLSVSDQEVAAEVLCDWLNSWKPGRFWAAFSTVAEDRSSKFLPALKSALKTLDQSDEDAIESMRRLYSDGTEADLSAWAAREIEHRREAIEDLIEELSDPRIGADRWRLRDAFRPWFKARFPCESARASLRPLHAELYAYDRLLIDADPMLYGQDVDRSQFGPNPELKAALTELTSSPDEEVRQFAVEHLAYYEILEAAHIAARDVRHI